MTTSLADDWLRLYQLNLTLYQMSHGWYIRKKICPYSVNNCLSSAVCCLLKSGLTSTSSTVSFRCISYSGNSSASFIVASLRLDHYLPRHKLLLTLVWLHLQLPVLYWWQVAIAVIYDINWYYSVHFWSHLYVGIDLYHHRPASVWPVHCHNNITPTCWCGKSSPFPAQSLHYNPYLQFFWPPCMEIGLTYKTLSPMLRCLIFACRLQYFWFLSSYVWSATDKSVDGHELPPA